ncbi:MAG: AzlD domain-containing protein [Treponema sp.]|jgi:branched-subunit amino acid transport protein AzlD|nr:AzlD domain-containing protein [Treponema sp.]
MNNLYEAVGFVFTMGAVIIFCRFFPFLFFSGSISRKANGKTSIRESFINFVEKIVPPTAMTVLAFNALGAAFQENPGDGLFVLTASVFTALIHIWKRNTLISIIGGTALYMILIRITV